MRLLPAAAQDYRQLRASAKHLRAAQRGWGGSGGGTPQHCAPQVIFFENHLSFKLHFTMENEIKRIFLLFFFAPLSSYLAPFFPFFF